MLIAIITLCLSYTQVVIANDHNITKSIGQNSTILFKFCDTYSVMCKQLSGVFYNTSQLLSQEHINCSFIEVDPTRSPATRKKYNVKNIPIIKLLINNTILLDYYGKYSPAHIMEWVKSMVFTPYNIITLNEYRQIVSTPNALIWINPNNTSIVGQYARKFTQLNFNILYIQNYNGEAIQIVNSARERYEEIFIQNLTYSLEVEIQIRLLPSYTNFDENIATLIIKHQVPTIAVIGSFIDNTTKSLEKEVQQVAKNYSQYLFVRFNVKDILTEEMVAYLGVSNTTYPCIMILEKSEKAIKKYLYYRNTSISNFIYQFEANILPRWYKSQEPILNRGPLLHVVGKNAKSIIIDSNKNVILVKVGTNSNKEYLLISQVAKILSIMHHINFIGGYYNYLANECDFINAYESSIVLLYLSNNKSHPIAYECTQCGINELFAFIKSNVPSTPYYGYITEVTSIEEI